MSKDYVLFIHGVSTRSTDYADGLVNLIKQTTPIEPLVVCWGDVSEKEEDKLRTGYKASPIWDKLWFKDLRDPFLLQFAGDTALYLSRAIGAEVVAKVAKEVAKIKDPTAEDRLHLVAHSLGSVILFDLLFSTRWDGDANHPANKDVMAIRDAVYGVTGEKGKDPKQGILLGSITTMGSPIGVFSLMNVNASSTHDITPGLKQLLDNLHQALGGQELPWRNFVHPGDPIASPLQGVIPDMVDGEKRYIDILDELIPVDRAFKGLVPKVLLDWVGRIWPPISVLDGLNAHGSYWQSPRVVEGIIELIKQARASDAAIGIEPDRSSTAPSR